jgi:hypothetical protein
MKVKFDPLSKKYDAIIVVTDIDGSALIIAKNQNLPDHIDEDWLYVDVEKPPGFYFCKIFVYDDDIEIQIVDSICEIEVE